MIYCINPYCEGRENIDDAELCASCGTPLFVLDRLNLVRKISTDSELDIFEVIDSRKTFSGASGSRKILKVLKSTDPDRIKAFQTESLILQSLNHRAIPKVDALYDDFEINVTGSNRNFPCLIMTKFEGLTLEEHVLSNGAINQKVAINYLQQLGSILNYIHTEKLNDEGGVIHRDIKPGNIIVQPSGDLGLIDFGYSLIMSETYQTRLGSGIGENSRVETIYYTPPEQVARRPIPQSDYFALGMTIIFALTGRQLYEMEMRSWQPQWQQYVKHLDKPFIQFLDRLTSLDAYKRPATAEELFNIVSTTLPEKLKWRTRLRSTPYRVAIGMIVALIGVSLFHVGRSAIYEYNFSQASRAMVESRFAQAKQGFELSINILPKAETYTNLGLACVQLGDFTCAQKAYQNAIQFNPRSWEAYYNLAGYYEDKPQPDIQQAEIYYRKAKSLNPNAIQPLNNLARVLILRRGYEEAEKLILKAMQLKPEPNDQASLNKNLGWIYLEKKQFKKSENYLKKAINLNPNLVSPHCLLAKLNEKWNKLSSDEIQSCLILTGDDAFSIEVLQWRMEQIQKLQKSKTSPELPVWLS